MPTVAIGAHRFYYEEQGSGAPVLLVHETGSGVDLLANVARELSSSYRVISYDRRGFGRSEAPLPPPASYLERSSEDAAILLRELGAPRARIVGWGMGAVISLALAAQHEVAQLVLVEPLLHAKKQLRLRLVMAAALGMAKVGLQRRAAKRYLRFVFGQGLDDERHSAFDELDEPTRKRLLASPRTVLAEIESGTGEELTRTALARIRCSAGVVVGEGSAPFLQEAADRTARALGGRVERVVKGDHASTYRRPEALVATLRAALQAAPRAGAK